MLRQRFRIGLAGPVAVQALTHDPPRLAFRRLRQRARVLLVLVAMLVAQRASGIEADSERGAELFHTLQCVQCHSVNGEGGNLGPDLGRQLNRGFTPASLAGAIWNHAPAMWTAMQAHGVRPDDMNQQAATDLFTYFYSVGFFERPGDAGRGKQLFTARHCANCHGLDESKIPEAKPASQWQSVEQPIMLVNEMWNHAATMRKEFAGRSWKWPELTTQDLIDILVYLRKGSPSRMEITSGTRGEAIFRSKGCESCHSSMAALSTRVSGETLTGIAVAMWNHAPRMPASPPMMDINEMQEIAGSLWAEQFFRNAGSSNAGKRVYRTRHCAACHDDPASGAPKLAGHVFSGAVMISALWRHGPQMLDQLQVKKLRWPRFENMDMANLIAYLNSLAKEK